MTGRRTTMSKKKASAPITLDGIIEARQRSLGLTDDEIIKRLGLGEENIVALLRQGKVKPSYRLVPALSDLLDVNLIDLIRAMVHDSMRDVMDSVKPIYESRSITSEGSQILTAYNLAIRGEPGTKTIRVPGATVFVVPDEEPAKASRTAAK